MIPLPPDECPAALRTRTLTLVVQQVVHGQAPFMKNAALALVEYALDIIRGTGGNGQYERHLSANKVRIEAIGSIFPSAGAEAVDGLAPVAGTDALRARLQNVRDLTTFLKGGENATEMADYAGMSHDDARQHIVEMLDDIEQALEQDAP